MAGREHDDVEAQLSLMKREIDALQIEASRAGAKWYKQVPVVVSVLVSVLALAFSFGTTIVSERRLAREDDHEARVELRSLIQRLTALPKENFDLSRNYRKDPVAVQQLSGFTKLENTVLSKQAAELTNRIAEDVTATEYYTISIALENSGFTHQSGELAARGVEAAEDAQEEVELLRLYGNHLFMIGDTKAGRDRYQQAMEVFEHYPEKNSSVVADTHLNTQLFWAEIELNSGQCRQARSHFDSARSYLLQLKYARLLNPRFDALMKRIEDDCASKLGHVERAANGA
jgi:tetratricopeptide (TPR) repeat protein